jgi:transmembrane sensor
VSDMQPIHLLLEAGVDAPAARRMWQGVARRRQRRNQAQHRRGLLVAFVVGVASALCVIGLMNQVGVAPRTAHADSTLKLRGGQAWSSIDASGSAKSAELDDGSRIEVDGGRLTTLENTDRSLVLLLAEGRASFDVHPGGPRRWSIEAGVATVEVVGTRFTVVREADQVVVEVERGVVLVRGETVADRVQRLVAGERLVVVQQRALASPALSTAIPSGPSEPPPDRSKTAEPQPEWNDLAQRGAYSEAYEKLGTRGIAAQVETADLDRLLRLADVARLSGHPADAVEPLRRVITEHRADSRAALAAFTLGRLHLDSLRNPAAASSDFRTAIGLRLPSALLEDAHLRWIEAAAKAGDRRQAREAYDRYRSQFPQSPRTSIADRWAREP